MTERTDLATLSRALRKRLAWDAEDGLPGFRPVDPARVLEAIGQAVARRPAEPPSEPVPADRTLPAIREELGDCQRCPLAHAGRQNIVFGEGSPSARLMFIGESPGFHEDQQGRPSLGAAGELLDKMIEAMSLRRADVYITTLVKCRAGDDREPTLDECLACRPFLEAQIQSVQPEVIVALGPFVTRALLGTEAPFEAVRGTFHDGFGSQLMPTFHPSHLLRSPADKRVVWEDLKLVMGELGLRQERA